LPRLLSVCSHSIGFSEALFYARLVVCAFLCVSSQKSLAQQSRTGHVRFFVRGMTNLALPLDATTLRVRGVV
jgi:hypothetical protein